MSRNQTRRIVKIACAVILLMASATSGTVTAELPEQPGFTAQISSTSGDIP